MIRSEIFDDIYFSAANGWAETQHVFLGGNNLAQRWVHEMGDRTRFTIAETGFGTGLNMLSAWALFDEVAPDHLKLDLVSFELYPLTKNQIAEVLAPWADKLGQHRIDALLRDYPLRVAGWHRIDLSPRVTLTLIFDDVNAALSRVVIPGGVDAWFLDGFAPAKNPGMWTETVFNGMARLCAPGATFATFTAAGFVKRAMREAGYTVNRKRGFGYKWHMLAGSFPGTMRAAPQPQHQKIAVIGGGLAGTSVARVLADDGYSVVLFERDDIASGASGNLRGMINPRISALRSSDSDFYASAYVRALRVVTRYPDAGFMACGNLHLIRDADKGKRFTSCRDHWGWHADHMQIVDADDASDIAGVRVDHAALYLPDGGQVSPRDLCRAMAQGIERRGGVDMASIVQVPSSRRRPGSFAIREEDPGLRRDDDGGAWAVDGEIFDAVVLASGIECLKHPALSSLPLHTVRGQIMNVEAGHPAPRANLCFSGYIGAAQDGVQVMGSTFQKWLDTTDLRDEDNDYILDQAHAAVPAFVPGVVMGARASLRCAAQDRFPVIGAVADQPGLYVSTAHGSHGIVSSMAGARIVADMIGGGVWSLPGDVVDALNPARFARRAAQKA
ncbi:FAD-dependent 5-carboxymethylaminomethyl-2-thiouridine(34) oxidoreductase MnmC [Micavibrio aeruginosavorus]|uniref:FAD-dependent 5-carboxymethylaminomethyl-2-thiouridine(34) oxidoreductase MnmC n=1 Tax=Micavibrio aeruginosavorus TaxID=349221 RepID=UPI003F4A9DF2